MIKAKLVIDADKIAKAITTKFDNCTLVNDNRGIELDLEDLSNICLASCEEVLNELNGETLSCLDMN